MAAPKAAGPQPAAFLALALDSGARKGELCGLRWADVDLDAGKVRIVQQLLSTGAGPTFGPTKTGRPRTVSVSAEVVDLLRAHRKHQRELLMANRNSYRDLGLVFAKEWSDVRNRGDRLGHPLQATNLGQREYARLIKAVQVRPIKFHGLRHTLCDAAASGGAAGPRRQREAWTQQGLDDHGGVRARSAGHAAGRGCEVGVIATDGTRELRL